MFISTFTIGVLYGIYCLVGFLMDMEASAPKRVAPSQGFSLPTSGKVPKSLLAALDDLAAKE